MSEVLRVLSIRIELINHYPWLPSLKRFYSDIADKAPAEFIKEVFSGNNGIEIKQRLLSLFEAAFENKEEISDYKIDKLNVYVYLLLKIVLYVLNDKNITNKIANLYSKINYNELQKDNKDVDLYDICEDLKLYVNYYQTPIKFGVNLVKNQRESLETNFTMHFIDYLGLTSKLKDEYRKLAHNALSGGFVFIQNRRLMRLLQEYVREKLILKETKDKTTLNSFIENITKVPEFKDLYDKILTGWSERKDDFEFTYEFDFSTLKDPMSVFPPCVKEILKKAKEGQNLVHYERLFIVWFLLALEYPIEKIVDIFSTMPDFDREKTTYQVKFAEKKKYVPYQCSTLKTYNLCIAAKYKDELCAKGYFSKKHDEERKIKHPLSYVRIKEYRIKRKDYIESKVNNKSKQESENQPDKIKNE